jgi:hypothetical protein
VPIARLAAAQAALGAEALEQHSFRKHRQERSNGHALGSGMQQTRFVGWYVVGDTNARFKIALPDYIGAETLRYVVWQVLSAVGKSPRIEFGTATIV